MRKLIVWGLILLTIAGLVAGFFWLRRSRADAGVPEILKTAEVIQGDLQLSISSSGTVSVRRTTRVTTRITGRVERVLVSLQERVKEGQVLAALDSADLRRAVDRAEIAVQQAELALATAQRPADDEQIHLAEATLNSAAQALELARISTETARVDADAMIVQAQRQREQAYIRFREASEGDAKTQAQTAFDQAESQEEIARLNAQLTLTSADEQYKAATIAYLKAQDNLAALTEPADEDTVAQRVLDVEQARLRRQQAQRALSDSELKAPHPGVIAAIDISEGAVERAGDLAFTIVDDSEIYVETTVDEIDIGAVATGLKATLVPDAYPDRVLQGAVDSIAPASINVGGLVAYRVRIRVAATEELRLLDGMAVVAQIVTGTLPGRTLAPAWAVRRDETTAEPYCWRVEGGTVQRVPVRLGSSNGQFVEIAAGLVAGDTVALVAEERNLLDMAPQGGPPWANQ